MIMTDAPKFCVGDAVCLSHAGHTVYDDIKWFADQIYTVIEVAPSSARIKYYTNDDRPRYVWIDNRDLELVLVCSEFSDDEFLGMIGVC